MKLTGVLVAGALSSVANSSMDRDRDGFACEQ
jgi:hypothetical protein